MVVFDLTDNLSIKEELICQLAVTLLFPERARVGAGSCTNLINLGIRVYHLCVLIERHALFKLEKINTHARCSTFAEFPSRIHQATFQRIIFFHVEIFIC